MRTSFLAAGLSIGLAAPGAASDLPTFAAYLEEMDRTEVSFSGFVYFDPSASTGGFGFLQEEGRGVFGAVVDAGREVRERIETECQSNSFMIDRDRICRIEGSGSVEIRESRIFMSIETVTTLEPATR